MWLRDATLLQKEEMKQMKYLVLNVANAYIKQQKYFTVFFQAKAGV